MIGTKLKLSRVVDCWREENDGDPVIKCELIFKNEINGNFIKGTIEEPESKIIEQQAFFRSEVKKCPNPKKPTDCFFIPSPGAEGSYDLVAPADMKGKNNFYRFLEPFLEDSGDGYRRLKTR